MNPGFWDRIWTVHYIGPTTVNFVDDPLNPHAAFLMVPLFMLATAIFLVLLIRGKRWNVLAAAKAFVVASAVSALFFALVTDYRWFKQWEADRNSLARLSIDERIAFLNRGWSGEYALARELKRLLPADETVRLYSGPGFQEGKFAYYLLPVRLSKEGSYTLVFQDDSVSYDPDKGTLMKGDTVTGIGMTLLADSGKGIYLLKGKGGPVSP